jgi:hypothetical protein
VVPNWATHLAVAAGIIVVGVGAVVVAALANAPPWLSLPGTALLIGGLAGLFVVRDRVRRALMARAAARAGWVFEAEAAPDTLARLQRFPLLRRGRGRAVSNVLHVTANGRSSLVADVEFITGGGRYARSTWQTVLVMDAPGRTARRPEGEAGGWTVERSHGECCVYRKGWSATAAGVTDFVTRAAAVVEVEVSPLGPSGPPP